MKILLSIFTTFSMMFMLSGCVTKYVHIPAECPHIEVKSTVPTISGPIDDNGSISAVKLDELLKGCSDLRKRTDYYEYTIPKYNKDYNTSK